jgi:shikimate dehydrogenase
MDWLYVPLPVKSENIAAALKGLSALGLRGANVTVPHKQRVMPFLDELTDDAARIGAVNTIVVKPDGRLLGANTDWKGFLNHLTDVDFDPAGREALIMGSGGSARAVGYALVRRGAKVTICSRNEKTAQLLSHDLACLFPRYAPVVRTMDRLSDSVANADLMVNTTPLGMSPQVEASPWPDELHLPTCKLVYDLVYNPPVTRFMERAQKEGIAAVNGLGMLAHQAALAFEMWTGATAPIEIMKQTVRAC